MAIIAKKKLSEKVVDEIRQRMDSGELKIGDKLPNQNQLSQELGVSRTSLREAMNTLSLLGVIEQKPGFGTAIRKKIPEINPAASTPILLSDSQATWELLEARVVIETSLARLAAQHATDEEAQTLADHVGDMKAHLEKHDWRGYAQGDLLFHSLISEFAGNRFLQEAYISIKQHMALFIQEHIEQLPDVLEISQRHHEAVSHAITAHDPDVAGVEMEKHMLFLQKSFQSYEDVKKRSSSKK